MTHSALARSGATLLDDRVVELGGVRLWGWPDPNRTRFGRRDAYVSELGRQRAPTPPEETPYVVAVHNAAMARGLPRGVSLVLCGHAHVPKVWTKGSVTFARTGTAGGGGPDWPWQWPRPWRRPAPCQALVVDLELPGHTPAGMWFVESDGHSATVTPGSSDAGVSTLPAR